MKLKAILAGLITWTILFILLPFYIITINYNLNLLSYTTQITKIMGLLLIITGIVIFTYCSKLFSKLGLGTPAPIKPPKKLVIEGLYKYSRNPIYLSYFIILVGEFSIFGHILLLAYLIAIILFVNIYVIHFEEPKLKKRFEVDYVNYTKQVPRWIVNTNNAQKL